MFLSSQFEGREGCVQTVPWGQGDRADWPDHRVLPPGERRDTVVDFCLATVSRAPRHQGEERSLDGELPVVWKRVQSRWSPELAFLRVGPGAGPPGPWAELLWQDREWCPPLAFLSPGSPWDLFVCVFFFSYFIKCLNSVSSSSYSFRLWAPNAWK